MKLAVLATLAGCTATAILDAVPHDVMASLPTVPKVMNAGRNGMPQLPSMDAMFAQFEDTSPSFDSQASGFSTRLAAMEKESKRKIAKKRSEYDLQLKEQEKKNQAIVKQNSLLAKQILELHKQSERLEQDVKATLAAYQKQRGELLHVDEQFNKARDAAQQAASLADAALQEDAASATETAALGADRKLDEAIGDSKTFAEEADHETLSFLELSSRTQREQLVQGITEHVEDEELINMLAKEMRGLRKSTTSSMQQLKKVFEESYRAGEKRHQALLKQQQMLKETLAGMPERYDQLKVTAEQLHKKQSLLEAALQGKGLLIGDLQKAALAPMDEVPQALKRVTQTLRALRRST